MKERVIETREHTHVDSLFKGFYLIDPVSHTSSIYNDISRGFLHTSGDYPLTSRQRGEIEILTYKSLKNLPTVGFSTFYYKSNKIKNNVYFDSWKDF